MSLLYWLVLQMADKSNYYNVMQSPANHQTIISVLLDWKSQDGQWEKSGSLQ